MSGETTSESASADEPTASIPLDDFCKGLSVTDRRVELIAGFHSDELRAGRLHDVESAYRERLEAFAVRPVK